MITITIDPSDTPAALAALRGLSSAAARAAGVDPSTVPCPACDGSGVVGIDHVIRGGA